MRVAILAALIVLPLSGCGGTRTNTERTARAVEHIDKILSAQCGHDEKECGIHPTGMVECR